MSIANRAAMFIGALAAAFSAERAGMREAALATAPDPSGSRALGHAIYVSNLRSGGFCGAPYQLRVGTKTRRPYQIKV